MKPLRRGLVFFAVSVVSVAFDQFTKVLAIDALKGKPALLYLGDLFRFQFATNDGAFLSLGSSLPPGARYWVLTIGVGVLLLGITVYTHLSTKVDGPQVVGYALIVSGGFSNWVDRARFEGVVVDFMNLGLGRLRTGVFNVADLAIVAGILVLLVHGWRLDRVARQKLDDSQKTPA